jgi:hypothetical protein
MLLFYIIQTNKKPTVMLKRILSTSFFIQLSLRPFIRRSRQVISFLEEPFYRTNDPMGSAILTGVILGCLVFMLFSGKNLFGA